MSGVGSGPEEEAMASKRLLAVICGLALSVILSASTAAGVEKRVELVLDASGSMMGKLPSGERKITVAMEAVDKLVGCLDPGLEVAFRAYGHQSHRDKKDCADTELLVPFAPLEENREKIRSALPEIQAQGFTPISYVLGLAAADFADTAGENVIILLSDGRETCDGDPCVLAQQLKAKHVELVIHCVGLGVDAATRGQLECIAAAAGGKYFDVDEAEILGATLVEAANTPGELPQKYIPGPGKLQVEGADLRGHQVIDAVSGRPLDVLISHVQETIDLPAGIYHVTVAGAVWKSVKVVAGRTTVLRPGYLSIDGACFRGHDVLEAETGYKHGSLSNTQASITLMPGDYLVTFGPLTWPARVAAGEKLLLKPGIVAVDGAHYGGHVISTTDGRRVGEVSNTASSMPLPPGSYVIEIDGKTMPFELRAGERKVFRR